jgi:nucleoside-diphosphate-sugar epimerase
MDAMAPRTIAVTGASGYIGRPLLRQLLARPGVRVKALSRRPAESAPALAGVHHVVQGDLRDPRAALALLEPGCDVVHLAHLWSGSAEDNLDAARRLFAACNEKQVRRVVHLSSVAVFGRVPGDRVDERSPCRPVIAYGKTKLEIELLLRRECRVPYVIVRPTTVFGEPGPPLDGLIADLRAKRRFAAYLRSVVFGERRMNLVHADNVAAAIVFLLEKEPFPSGEALIVSQDDHPANNFRDVELCLMEALGVADHGWPRFQLPAWILAALLRLRGHNNVNPRRRFDGGRIAALGFAPPVDFRQGLAGCAARIACPCTS